jgi:hypothetical protein
MPDHERGHEGRNDHPGQGHNPPHGHPQPHPVEIRVNTRPFTVPDNDVSFEEVVGLAFPGSTPGPQFRVSYENAVGPNTDGNLVPGTSVKVHKGTIFHVTPTDKS